VTVHSCDDDAELSELSDIRDLLAGVLKPGVMSPGNGVVNPRGSTAVVFMSPIVTFLFSTESGTGLNLQQHRPTGLSETV